LSASSLSRFVFWKLQFRICFGFRNSDFGFSFKPVGVRHKVDKMEMAGVMKTKDLAESFSAFAPKADTVGRAPAKPALTTRKVLQIARTVLKGAGKPALVAALGLTVVWFLGRVMEALHGNAVFDITLTYWLGLVIFILLALWAIGSGIRAMDDFGKVRDKKTAVISWIFFLVLVFTVLFSIKGYRISSEGLFAAVAGSTENSRQTTFLLFKFHSLNPMLALNLAASKLAGIGWGMESLAPYVLGWNALFEFFIWSLAFGIVILMQKDKRGPKSLHLFLASFGLLGLIILKSLSRPTLDQMIVIQAAAAILLVFQVLLAYATLRAMAAGAAEDVPSPDAFRVYSPGEEQAAEKRFIGLPPSALTLVLALFLVVPVLTDLRNQFGLSYSSNRIVRQISMNQSGSGPKFVAVTAVSIRSGPATGDDVLGILPKGTSFEVLDKKNDWVNIGDNRWVPEKFLRPIK
jgi:hypothetical protein